MRLYSRKQVLLIAFSVTIIALLSGIAIGIIPLQKKTTNVVKLDAETLSETPADAKVTEAIPVYNSVSGYTQDELENIDVYERLNSGVVNITTEVVSINWFLEPVPKEGGSGSGSIIDSRGYVLTNYHVVKGAYKVFINLSDGSRIEGQVIGSDSENDLSVVKFEPPKGSKLTVIPYGESSNLKVGQKVLAIGNPFGLERTLTRGIVSGLGRPVQQDSTTIIRDMIQTDASINPGNSGGPLLNSHGEIIGVNTMIYSPSGGSVGVGFAVPVNTAKRIVPDLIQYGKVRRGWIDAEFVQIFPALIEYMEEKGSPLPVKSGLLISTVTRGGNAEKSGLRGGTTAARYYQSVFNVGGDIIYSVNGKVISSLADLYSALENTKVGETVKVEYYRGSKKLSVNIVLSERTETK